MTWKDVLQHAIAIGVPVLTTWLAAWLKHRYEQRAREALYPAAKPDDPAPPTVPASPDPTGEPDHRSEP